MAPIIRDAEKRDLSRLLELHEQLAEGGQLTPAEAKVEPDRAWYGAAFEAVWAKRRELLLVLEDSGCVIGTLVVVIVAQVATVVCPGRTSRMS